MVHRRRDHGGVIFIDLRDRTGLCQVALSPETIPAEQFEKAHDLRDEFVLAIRDNNFALLRFANEGYFNSGVAGIPSRDKYKNCVKCPYSYGGPYTALGTGAS